MRARSTLALALVVVVMAGCGDAATPAATGAATSAATTSDARTPDATTQAATAPDADVPAGDVLEVVVQGERPHDATAFTQGLEFDDGRLFESRGLTEEDVILAEVDPADGSTVRAVRRQPGDQAFYEGLTVVDDRIIQLTWQDGVAHVYDLDTLERTGTFTYDGEGWGICDQPDRLIMSDGTAELTHRDPATFEVLDTVTVDLAGQPNDDLNELECVGDVVWANLWNTDVILVIDPDTGEVVSEVDASAIADPQGRYVDDPRGGAVLNGIAHDATTGTWLLTGKQWPVVVEASFDCVEGCQVSATPSHYVRPDDVSPLGS